MTGFAMFAAGAVTMIVLAALLLRPAWRPARATNDTRPANLEVVRDQLDALDRELDAGQLDVEQHRLARRELERRLLDEAAAGDATAAPSKTGTPESNAASNTSLWAVGALVPVFAIALYAAIGNLAALEPQPEVAARGAPDAGVSPDVDISPAAVDAMLTKLAQRLETPSADTARDVKGWTMLGRSYAALQRFPEADKAYARAIALAPANADLLADRADLLAVMQGRNTAGEPDRLIAEALRLDPVNLKALALAGSGAYDRKDFAAARRYWQKARELAPPGSEIASDLDRSLAEMAAPGSVTALALNSTAPPSRAAPGNGASAVSGNGPANSPSPSASTAAATVTAQGIGAARIAGRVSLAPALAAKALPTDTVFVFARAAEGPRMPLAIVKRTVAELPFTFTLDDSMAMSPQMKLSTFPRVVVGARVSRSGNAMPQPGDLRGESAAVASTSNGLQLVIDAVQP